MKLVTDGESWAIKRGFWIFARFYDFRHGYWWGTGSKWLNDCWTDEKAARTYLKRMTA